MQLKRTTPPFQIPATALFAHASRVSDSWAPTPEVVALPPRHVAGGEVTISAAPGDTRELGIPLRSRHPRRILNHRRTIDLGDRLVFDARFETDGNVAHQLGSVAIRVLLARRELSAALGRPAEITVVLRDGATGYSQAIYQQLGVPVLTTDRQVRAQVVRVDDPHVATRAGRVFMPGGSHASLVLTPEILTPAPFRSADPGDLPEKIFLARRGTRSLINDAEITDLLAARGFRKFYFEEVPYDRQMLLCRHARVIAGIHGAAMAYMVFNGHGLARPPGDLSGLRVIELFGPGYAADLYRRYSAVLNAHWCCVRGQITAEVIRDLDERGSPRGHEASPFRVDPEALEMALDYSDRASAAPPPPAGSLSHLWPAD